MIAITFFLASVLRKLFYTPVLISETFAGRLKRTGTLPSYIFKLGLDKFVIDGLDIKDFISATNIDLNILSFKEPQLEIFHRKKTILFMIKNSQLFIRISPNR